MTVPAVTGWEYTWDRSPVHLNTHARIYARTHYSLTLTSQGDLETFRLMCMFLRGGWKECQEKTHMSEDRLAIIDFLLQCTLKCTWKLVQNEDLWARQLLVFSSGAVSLQRGKKWLKTVSPIGGFLLFSCQWFLKMYLSIKAEPVGPWRGRIREGGIMRAHTACEGSHWGL